jgi:acetolactate synthase-1/2/3 large subunit
MVRQWQDMFFDRRYSGVDLSVSPDFVKLAEAYDCLGLRATNEDEVDAVIERALEERERPVVIDFRVSREENVFPMIPAGGSVNEMRLE